MSDEPREPPKLRPVADIRDGKGRFKKGNGGRRPGQRNRVSRVVTGLFTLHAPELVERVLDLARNGDVGALRIALDRIAPAPRDAPIELALPPVTSAADLPAAFASVLEAVASGRLTPSEAERVASLLANAGRLLEAADLEARIAALEAKAK